MTKLTDASQKLEALVDLLRTAGGFDLTAQVFHTDFGHPDYGHINPGPAGPRHADPRHAGPGKSTARKPELIVEFAGPDSSLLTDRNGELLLALEHIAAKMLRLDSDEHDRVSFDAENFKANRDLELVRQANAAVAEVRSTLCPYTFPPMTSRERRILHLALTPSGLKSASTGDGFKRSVVLYPDGMRPSGRPPKYRPRSSPPVARSTKSG